MGTVLIEGVTCDFELVEVLPTGFHRVNVYYNDVTNVYIVDPVYNLNIVVQIKNKDKKGSKWLHSLLVDNKIIRVVEKKPGLFQRLFLRIRKPIKKENFTIKLW